MICTIIFTNTSFIHNFYFSQFSALLGTLFLDALRPRNRKCHRIGRCPYHNYQRSISKLEVHIHSDRYMHLWILRWNHLLHACKQYINDHLHYRQNERNECT